MTDGADSTPCDFKIALLFVKEQKWDSFNIYTKRQDDIIEIFSDFILLRNVRKDSRRKSFSPKRFQESL